MGAHLVGALLREPSIETVVAIDSVKPSAQFRRRMGGAEVVRIDLQSPRLQGILREHAIDTIVHAGLHHNDFTPGGRAATKEANIMGSMHVIAAAGRAASVKRFVLLSSTSVYGSSGVDPVLFSEEMAARRSPGGGIPRDYLSVEGYVRGMNRKRPDIEVTILRMPAILGLPEPTVFGELLQPTITPVLAGYDPRVQLLHPSDALDALQLAATRGPAGTFNIAADGVVTLSQAIRRAGHIPVPVLSPFFRIAAGVLSAEGLKNIGPSQLQYLRFGRGVDTRRMRDVFGFQPRYTTEEALTAYFKSSGTHPMVSLEFIRKALNVVVAATPPTARPAIRWAMDQIYDEIAKPAPSVAALPAAQRALATSSSAADDVPSPDPTAPTRSRGTDIPADTGTTTTPASPASDRGAPDAATPDTAAPDAAAGPSVIGDHDDFYSRSDIDTAMPSLADRRVYSTPAGVAARRAGSRTAVEETTAAISKESRRSAPVTKRAAAKFANTIAARKAAEKRAEARKVAAKKAAQRAAQRAADKAAAKEAAANKAAENKAAAAKKASAKKATAKKTAAKKASAKKATVKKVTTNTAAAKAAIATAAQADSSTPVVAPLTNEAPPKAKGTSTRNDPSTRKEQ